MTKFVSIITITSLILISSACNQNKKQSNQNVRVAITDSYYSVDEIIAKADSLANKTIQVEGIIEHVCKHTWKRFKIVDGDGTYELKIELGDKFQSVVASIIGKKVKVTGKLIPVQMDEKMVKQWEQKMKENHKGEENTGHYKEELEFIQSIYKQITSGEIPYYTMYSVTATNYEFK